MLCVYNCIFDPRVRGLPNTAGLVQIRSFCQSRSSLAVSRCLFRCIFDWNQPAFLLRILCYWRKLHNYLTWLLRSPQARAPYIVLFDLKQLIEDSILQVYMYYVHARKRASGAPRTHFRECKISKFPGGVPPDPLALSLFRGPLAPPILSAALFLSLSCVLLFHRHEAQHGTADNAEER